MRWRFGLSVTKPLPLCFSHALHRFECTGKKGVRYDRSSGRFKDIDYAENFISTSKNGVLSVSGAEDDIDIVDLNVNCQRKARV